MNFKKNQPYIIWILFALTLLRLFFGNAAFPLFNNVDEHAHFDTVVKYSAGNLPNPRNVKFDLESAKYIVLYGSPEYITRPENYTSKEMPLPNWKTLNDISQETLDAKFTEWTSTKNHEVFSPPIYYSIQGAWFSFGKLLGLDGGYLLYWLRFVNVFVFLGLFWITYIALRKFFPEDLILQTSVLTLLAFFPQDVFYSINSDTFSPLLCFSAFFLLIELYFDDKPLMNHILIGVLASLAFLVKIANLPLFAIIGLILLLKAKNILVQKKDIGQLFKLLFIVVTISLPVGLWFAWNLQTLGDLTGTAQKIKDLDWTLKPISEMFNHPIFTFDGIAYFFPDLFKTFWRGEFVWGMRAMATKNSDLFYSSSILFVLISFVNTLAAKKDYSDSHRFLNLMSFFYLLFSVGFLILLSMMYDFGKCWYPSQARPFFTSGRLMLGAMIPFLLLYVDGLRVVLTKISKRVNLLYIIIAISIFISQYEIISLITVAKSKYNLFHL